MALANLDTLIVLWPFFFSGLRMLNSVPKPKDKLHLPLSFYWSSPDFCLPSIFAAVTPAGHPPLAIPEEFFPMSSLSLAFHWTLSSHPNKFTWHLLRVDRRASSTVCRSLAVCSIIQKAPRTLGQGVQYMAHGLHVAHD